MMKTNGRQPARRYPEIVAEVSANHNGSLSSALEIVAFSAEAGVDAIKLQTYTPDTITLNSDTPGFMISESHELWGGRNLYSLYQEAHTPWEWHEAIFERAAELGLGFFSTPFDETAVDFLEALDVPRYKIASIEIVDIPLIRKIAQTGKPIILSTGASTLAEVAEAVETIRSAGNDRITLLACTSSYPAIASSSNLASMRTLESEFDLPVGFSDHTIGIGVSIAAAVLGATIIEKHVTLDTLGRGPDDGFSADPETIKGLVNGVREAIDAIGSSEFGFDDSEVGSRNLRPSLWITRDVSAGERISPENVMTLRPSGGLPPSAIDEVFGSWFTQDVAFGTPLTSELISKPIELGDFTD